MQRNLLIGLFWIGSASFAPAQPPATPAAAQQSELQSKRAELERLRADVRKLEAEIERLVRAVQPAQQVSLSVVVAEINMTKARAAKMNVKAFEHQQVFFTELTDDVQKLISPLKEAKVVKIISEPTLTTVLGRPAFFETGGEFPIPVSTPGGGHTIEYRKYGTRIDANVEWANSGKLRVNVRPSIMELDNERGVRLHGVFVPGIRTRAVDTSAEITPNKSLLLTGMLQQRMVKSPVGDAPAGSDKAKPVEHVEDIQLLVLITPKLVEPSVSDAKGLSPRR